MKADELHHNGTYAKAVLDDDSKDTIVKLMNALDLDKQVSKEELHTTIMYSRKPCPTAIEMNNKSISFEGTVKGLKTWDTRDGETCLVAVLDSDDLCELHDTMQKKYHATYDFPEYIPHITLSYDCGDGEKFKLPNDVYKVKYSTISVKPIKPLSVNG